VVSLRLVLAVLRTLQELGHYGIREITANGLTHLVRPFLLLRWRGHWVSPSSFIRRKMQGIATERSQASPEIRRAEGPRVECPGRQPQRSSRRPAKFARVLPRAADAHPMEGTLG